MHDLTILCVPSWGRRQAYCRRHALWLFRCRFWHRDIPKWCRVFNLIKYYVFVHWCVYFFQGKRHGIVSTVWKPRPIGATLKLTFVSLATEGLSFEECKNLSAVLVDALAILGSLLPLRRLLEGKSVTLVAADFAWTTELGAASSLRFLSASLFDFVILMGKTGAITCSRLWSVLD